MTEQPPSSSTPESTDLVDPRQILDKLVDVVIVHDRGRLVYVNQAGADLVGAPSPEPLLGRSMMDFVAPESTSSVVARARGLTLAGGVKSGNERVFLRLDGSRVTVETTGIALDARRTLVVIRDLSRAGRVERAGRSAESQLAAFTEVAIDGIAIARASDGRHVMANAAHARMFGFAQPEDEAGTTFLDLIAPAERPRLAELARQLTAGEIRAIALLTRGLRRDGTEFDLEVHAASFEDLDELYIAATLRDVTERRRAEEERVLLLDRLRHAEKLEAVGRLAGGIAHDFNNILSGILGYTELTQMALAPGSELFDHQQQIREATLRARALVRQILTFSRRDLVNPKRVDAPAAVTAALPLVRAALPSSIVLEPTIDPEAGAVLIDPAQLHQVVLNLCSNARDAVGERGRIELDVAAVDLDAPSPDLPPGRYVRLRVRDDGAGMDGPTLARIFEPYMTTKGPFGSHGLGLPVVHGIVTAAGGAVRVESAPGRGATFDVYLPWHPPAG
jgi:PAS domain S-box-containing protein